MWRDSWSASQHAAPFGLRLSARRLFQASCQHFSQSAGARSGVSRVWEDLKPRLTAKTIDSPAKVDQQQVLTSEAPRAERAEMLTKQSDVRVRSRRQRLPQALDEGGGTGGSGALLFLLALGQGPGDVPGGESPWGQRPLHWGRRHHRVRPR